MNNRLEFGMKLKLYILSITITLGACDMALTNYKPLTKDEKELLSNPKTLAAKGAHSEVKFKGREIHKINISNGKYMNVHFLESDIHTFRANYSSFTNASFKNSNMTGVFFVDNTLTNVTFDKVNFMDAVFNGATFINVTFKNCKINDSLFMNIKGNITFIDSELDSNDFWESQASLTFTNSYVNNKSNPRISIFSNQKQGSQFEFTDTVLAGANLDGTITSVKVSGGAILDSGFGGTIGSLEIDNADLNFSMKAKVKSVLVSNSNIELFGLGENIDHAAIRDCKSADIIAIMFANINELTIENCDIKTFEPLESKFSNFSLRNSIITDIDMQKTAIKEFSLNNVKFTEVNIEQAQAAEQNFNNVSVASSGSIKDTGSNIKLQ